MAIKVLWFDDDRDFLSSLKDVTERWPDVEVYFASTPQKAVEYARAVRPDILVTDLCSEVPRTHQFHGTSATKVGYRLIDIVKTIVPDVFPIVMTGAAAKSSSYQPSVTHLVKPDQEFTQLHRCISGLRSKVALRENAELTLEMLGEPNAILFHGNSKPAQALRASVAKVALSEEPVVIWGESGTGKELLARTIHSQSARRHNPFVAINLGAITESLLEDELFGHEKGAFTGAIRSRSGCFERAQRGTLFLDEISELPLDKQAVLLRVLQEGELLRLGAEKITPIDVRILCATNRDLRAEVIAGRFREDLYYRLSVIELHTPPLRERREDIPLLARVLLRKLAKSGPVRYLSTDALNLLNGYSFPGNVRELENLLRRGSVFADGIEISEAHLRLACTNTPTWLYRSDGRVRTWHEQKKEAERHILAQALKDSEGSVKSAGQALGLGASNLYKKLAEYGISFRKRES